MALTSDQEHLLRRFNKTHVDKLLDELVLTLVEEEGGRVYYQLDGSDRPQGGGPILPFESRRCPKEEVDSLVHLGDINIWEPGSATSHGDDIWRKKCKEY